MTSAEAQLLLQHRPEHDRTSCSDEQIRNHYTTEGRGGWPRCQRCSLLKAILDPEYAAKLTVEVRVRLPEIPDSTPEMFYAPPR